MLSERLALTFDYQGWMLEDGDLSRLSARIRQGLQVWGPGLTWYPGNPENGWGGMYLRASGGFALANLAITVLDDDLLEVEEERIDEWGWAIAASIGYEFFVTDSVGIGPALNFAYLSIESADADLSPDQQVADYGRWMTLTILGTWYFF
jgi:hypothetical protein